MTIHSANKQSTGHLASERQRRSGSVDSGKKSVPAPPPRSSSSQMSDGPEVKPRPSLNSNNKNSVGNNPNAPASRLGTSVVRSNSEPTPAQLAQLRPKSTPPEGESNQMMLDPSMVPGDFDLSMVPSNSTASLSSIDSQGSIIETGESDKTRQQLLEERHQELLRKQKLLQEQYTRLQQLSRGELPNLLLNDLKKTGSESNILSKSSSTSNVSGSLTHLPNNKKPHVAQQSQSQVQPTKQSQSRSQSSTPSKTTSMESKVSSGDNKKKESLPAPLIANKGDKSSKGPIKHETQKIYETDIL
ncbi:coiled-coil domain-containing protein AGAP005037-like [Tetranychus urticae]|uniref:Uncharacterized protein n=1 Tax=Tetranychus urticae TaxID=32264 RepID=T1K6R0_TETUR|nr:coiled-coil domain-containing protein AGAP005037-like [Tetranychus urticae]